MSSGPPWLLGSFKEDGMLTAEKIEKVIKSFTHPELAPYAEKMGLVPGNTIEILKETIPGAKDPPYIKASFTIRINGEKTILISRKIMDAIIIE